MKGSFNMQDKLKPILNKVNKKMKAEDLKKYYEQARVSAVRLNKQMTNSFNSFGAKLAKAGIPANAVSIAGFVIGLLAINFISLQMYATGLLFILINRLCDGLDGAIARKTKITDYGVFLDAVLDYVFYAGVFLLLRWPIRCRMPLPPLFCCLLLLLRPAPCWLMRSLRIKTARIGSF